MNIHIHGSVKPVPQSKPTSEGAYSPSHSTTGSRPSSVIPSHIHPQPISLQKEPKLLFGSTHTNTPALPSNTSSPSPQPETRLAKKTSETQLANPDKKTTSIDAWRQDQKGITPFYPTFDSNGSRRTSSRTSNRTYDPSHSRLVTPMPSSFKPIEETGDDKSIEALFEKAQGEHRQEVLKELKVKIDVVSKNEEGYSELLLAILMALLNSWEDDTYTKSDLRKDFQTALQEVYKQNENILKEFEANYEEEMQILVKMKALIGSDQLLSSADKADLLEVVYQAESYLHQLHDEKIEINQVLKEAMTASSDELMSKKSVKKLYAFSTHLISSLVSAKLLKALKTYREAKKKEAAEEKTTLTEKVTGSKKEELISEVSVNALLSGLFSHSATPEQLEGELAKALKLFDTEQLVTEDWSRLQEKSKIVGKSAIGDILDKVVDNLVKKYKVNPNDNISALVGDMLKGAAKDVKKEVKKKIDEQLPTTISKSVVTKSIESQLKPELNQQFQAMHQFNVEKHKKNLQLINELKEVIDDRIKESHKAAQPKNGFWEGLSTLFFAYVYGAPTSHIPEVPFKTATGAWERISDTYSP